LSSRIDNNINNKMSAFDQNSNEETKEQANASSLAPTPTSAAANRQLQEY
jgi:hypothetical protein